MCINVFTAKKNEYCIYRILSYVKQFKVNQMTDQK